MNIRMTITYIILMGVVYLALVRSIYNQFESHGLLTILPLLFITLVYIGLVYGSILSNRMQKSNKIKMRRLTEEFDRQTQELLTILKENAKGKKNE